jgi:hypothetical protein
MKNLFLFCIIFFPFFTYAQVNESDTLRLQSRISTTGAWQTGNVEIFTLRGKLDFSTAIHQKIVFKSQNSYLYQEFFNRRADEDLFSRNFLYYNPQAKVYPFAIGFIATNFRRQIDLRYFVGAGVTWQVLRQKNHLIKLALSGIYEKTNFTTTTFNKAEYNGQNQITTWRATLWLFGKHSLLNNKLILHYDCYFQPSVSQTDNLRWQAEIGADVPLYKGFSFTTNYIYTNESIVTVKQKIYDNILIFGLSYKIKY